MLLNQCLAISLSPVAAAASSAAVASPAVGGSRGRLDDSIESHQFAGARLRTDLHATQRTKFKSEWREINCGNHDDHTFSANVDNDGKCGSAGCKQAEHSSISWQQQQQTEKNNHQEPFKLKHSSALLLFTQLVEQNHQSFAFVDNNNNSRQASLQEQQQKQRRRRRESSSSSVSDYGYSLTRATSLGRPLPASTTTRTVSLSLAEQQSCLRGLSEALGRVEFAGFVMPSWLLVSGSYDDLHCIKSSWAATKLKSPVGFKIETIGNIRSVNVDYLGSAANELNKEQIAQVRSGRARRIEKSVKQPQQAQLSRLPYRLSLDQRDRRPPKFGASLNAAIVESVRELSKRNSNSRQTATSACAAGIHVSDLLDHLSSKYSSQLLDLPATEFIDCAISGLVRSSKLCLRPAARASRQRRRRQQRAAPERAEQHSDENTSTFASPNRDDADDNPCAGDRSNATQSAFLDQLISPGDEQDDNNNEIDCVANADGDADDDSDCDEQSLSGAELLMSQQRQQHHQRRASRISSSASTTKSKSTTLDSGIQSWDLVSASPTATELETGNNSSSSHNSSPSSLGAAARDRRRQQQRQSQRHDSSRLLFSKQQQQALGEAQAADKEACRRQEIIMMAATTLGSLQHRDGQVAAQSAAVSGGNAAAAASGQAATATGYFDSPAGEAADQHKRGRRGFSLSRSFSFRPKKSATVMSENDNNSNKEKERSAERRQQKRPTADRWSALDEQPRRAANSNLLAAADDQPALATARGQQPLMAQTSNKLADTNRDLCASRGVKGQQRQTLFSRETTRSSRFDTATASDDYEDFAPSINAFEVQQDANGSHASQWASHQPRSADHFNQHHDHRQATIDYLTTAQPHKRSFSTRRLTFTGAKEHDPTHSGSGGGKIVLFLRKLFNLRKTRLLDAADATSTANSTLHLMSTHSDNHSSRHDNHNQQRDEASGRGQRALATRDFRARSSRPLGPKHAFSASSSSSSSGSNSLIEILDCSRAVNSTRRLLREENALGFNRATWRLVRRSDSSLSRNSRASCETIKSTVSQQLRRHLDEAYRRHRNCTSQREKEFIDSINVLRQASRHALQNSRSSSKVRQAKSAKSSGNNGSASDDTASSVGFTSACANCCTPADGGNNNSVSFIAADGKQLCANCSCNQRLHANQQSIGGGPRREPSEANSGANGQAAIAQDFDLIRRRERQQQQQQTATALDNANLHNQQHQHQPQWLAPAPSACEHSSSFASNCCPICTSYLTSARLCPTLAGCCPPPPPAVGATACCLVGGQHARMPLLPGGDHQEAANVETAAAFCCPIWRSMVYNYCPTGFPGVTYQAAGAVSPSAGLQNHQQQQAPPDQQQLQPFGSQALENYSTSSSSSMHQHQVQQHQHNTTIDLKIEIGADLLKQAAAAANQEAAADRGASSNRQAARSRRVSSLAEQTTSGGSGRPILVEPPLSDSLDSNADDDDDCDAGDGYEADDYDGDDAEQTEESLEAGVVAVSADSAATRNADNNNSKITIREFELDSCDSDQSRLNSLRLANQVKLR